MKLSEKGHYAPPPPLSPTAQSVSETLAAWAGVHARTHWLLGDENEVDGADFYYGEEELGHIHLDSQAHVMHARPVTEALIQAGLARKFRWNDAVTVFDIRKQSDAPHALWLFQLSYDRRRGVKNAELLARIAQYVEGGAHRAAARIAQRRERNAAALAERGSRTLK